MSTTIDCAANYLNPGWTGSYLIMEALECSTGKGKLP